MWEDPIDITVVEANRGKCAPAIFDTVAPFTYESGCNAEAEQLEGTEVTVECLKVRKSLCAGHRYRRRHGAKRAPTPKP